MDKYADEYAIRRANLALVIKDGFDGVRARFAAKVEKGDATYIHRLLLDPSEKGAKNLGERKARQYERTLDLPRNWLDVLQTKYPHSKAPYSVREPVKQLPLELPARPGVREALAILRPLVRSLSDEARKTAGHLIRSWVENPREDDFYTDLLDTMLAKAVSNERVEEKFGDVQQEDKK